MHRRPSTTIVNHAWNCGSKKLAATPGRSVQRRRAEQVRVRHACQSGKRLPDRSCSDSCQSWPGSRSQRRGPIDTAAGPLAISYV